MGLGGINIKMVEVWELVSWVGSETPNRRRVCGMQRIQKWSSDIELARSVKMLVVGRSNVG